MKPKLLILAALLALSPFGVGREIDQAAMLRAQLPRFLNTEGVSMAPFIPRHGLVWVEKVEWRDLRPGMWVVVWPEGFRYSVLHCLTRREGPLWKTQGLNGLTNTVEDVFCVTPDNLVGVVRHEKK